MYTICIYKNMLINFIIFHIYLLIFFINRLEIRKQLQKCMRVQNKRKLRCVVIIYLFLFSPIFGDEVVSLPPLIFSDWTDCSIFRLHIVKTAKQLQNLIIQGHVKPRNILIIIFYIPWKILTLFKIGRPCTSTY